VSTGPPFRTTYLSSYEKFPAYPNGWGGENKEAKKEMERKMGFEPTTLSLARRGRDFVAGKEVCS